MFTAMDEARQRIFADKSLSKDAQYFCPICDGNVRLRAGNNNAPHFAHITSCTDDFTHDMSEWHRQWQELFPLKNREYVIKHNDEAHRADVLCYGTVIEFQHSPISDGEFRRRNQFYTSAGFKVIWIFDLIDVVDSDRMWCEEDYENQWDNGGKFRWNHPWRFLNGFLPQREKDIDIFFQIVPFGKNPKDKEEVCYMERVAWVNPHYKTPWGSFHTSVKVTNYAELLEWLKHRWEKEQQTPKNVPSLDTTFTPVAGSKYLSEGKVVEASELDDFLKENAPYRVIKVGSRNNPKDRIARLCADPHQTPCIQEGHCIYGCYTCLGMVEADGKQIIFCKSPYAKGQEYKPKIFRKVE